MSNSTIFELKAEQKRLEDRQKDLDTEVRTALQSRASMFNILLIEDSPSDAIFASNMFNQTGCQVKIEAVRTGAEAVAKLKEFTPDIILLDVNLPKIKGTDLLPFLMLDARCRQADIYLISASEISDEQLQVKPKDILTKPLDVETAKRLCNQCRL